MKQTKIKNSLKVHRIGSKHAFYYACIDSNNVTHVLMYSYDTPIFIVSNSTNNPDAKIHVVLNEDAYNYSRTTSKQIGQWISELHLFTSFGTWLPWGFRHVLATGKKDLTFDDVDYNIVNESIIRAIVDAMSYANLPSLELYQVR